MCEHNWCNVDHNTDECPPRERALRTCTVHARGETTEYVNKEDHEAALAEVREQNNWQWYENHSAEFSRRMEQAASQIRLLEDVRRVQNDRIVYLQNIVDNVRRLTA